MPISPNIANFSPLQKKSHSNAIVGVVSSLKTIDLNDDGVLDLVYPVQSTSVLQVWESTANGTYDAKQLYVSHEANIGGRQA